MQGSLLLDAFVRRFSSKYLFSKFRKFHRKTPMLERPATLLKRDSNTGVSCELCKIFNNTFCYRTPPVAASVLLTLNLFIFSLLLYLSYCLNSRSSCTCYSPKLLTLLFLYLSYFLNSGRNTVLIANSEHLIVLKNYLTTLAFHDQQVRHLHLSKTFTFKISTFK